MPIAPILRFKKTVVPAPAVTSSQSLRRIASVDVYRGFVMLLMMAEVLSLQDVAEALPQSSFWRFLAFHQSHVPWVGCSLHDMIQPSFSFLVGVVLPYSIAGRLEKGAKFSSLLRHAIFRSIILICLGIFLRSMHSRQTNFTFEDTLTQIGLGYTFLFILGFQSRRVQLVTLVVILVGYWVAFALYPLPGPGFDYAAAGVPANWQHNFEGFAAHWNINTNLGWAFDRWFLNLFPRDKVFAYNRGNYATLSFIPTLGTMLLGLQAGNVLKSAIPDQQKIKNFLIVGACLITGGLILHLTGVNPIIKKIWTPAWTLFSGGICFLFLALFYWLIDVRGKKSWAFFLMVIGANSIAAYVIADGGVRDMLSNSLHIHLGQNYDHLFGAEYSSLVNGLLVLFLEWLILYWMYKRKIFIKV